MTMEKKEMTDQERDEIDLENTTYDGHAWWPEDPEEFQRAVEEARPR